MRRSLLIGALGALAIAGCGSANNTVTLTHTIANQPSVTSTTTATVTQPKHIPTTTVTTPQVQPSTNTATSVITTPTTGTPTTYTVTDPGNEPVITGTNTTSQTKTRTGTSTTSGTTGGPVVHVASFSSPSGNIGCVLLGGTARCDIKHRDWSPPPAPASCQLDFGQGLYVAKQGRGHLVCAGDTALGATRKLPYGSSSRYGGFTCMSATDGMTCTRNDTGHGFFIAVQSYRTF